MFHGRGTMGNPQPSPNPTETVGMDAVHRLNGGGQSHWELLKI